MFDSGLSDAFGIGIIIVFGLVVGFVLLVLYGIFRFLNFLFGSGVEKLSVKMLILFTIHLCIINLYS